MSGRMIGFAVTVAVCAAIAFNIAQFFSGVLGHNMEVLLAAFK